MYFVRNGNQSSPATTTTSPPSGYGGTNSNLVAVESTQGKSSVGKSSNGSQQSGPEPMATDEDGNSRSFRLSVKFSDVRMVSITLSSEDIEEEEVRCHESLAAISKVVSAIDVERSQLEKSCQHVQSDIGKKEREQQLAEEQLRNAEAQMSLKVAESRHSGETHSRLKAAAKKARERSCETEHRLRELQLAVCRKKLQFTLSTQPADFKSEEYGRYIVKELAVLEDEEMIARLQKELVKCGQESDVAVAESDRAEQLCSALMEQVSACQQRVDQLKNNVNVHRSQTQEARETLESYRSRLADLSDRRCRQNRNHVELIQTLILVETCRKLKNIKEIE